MKFLNNIEVGSSPNFTLPLSDGSNGQILQTNGSGTVTWVDLPAGTTDTNDYVTAAAFNTATGVVTLTVQNQTAVTVNLDGRYLTAHPNISGATTSNNSGNTFIQDLTFDSNGHVTGVATASVSGFLSSSGTAWRVGADSHTGAGSSSMAVTVNSELGFQGINGISTQTDGDSGVVYIDGSSVVGSYSDWKLMDGSGNTGDIDNGIYVQFANSSISGTGTAGNPYSVSLPNTTYSAGSGLDLSGTTFSVETDLRDGIRYIGEDTNDYIVFNAVSGTQTQVYVDGSVVGAFRNDGTPEFHCDGDIIGYSSTISDRRLKKDIEPIENASEKVSRLRGVEYTWDKGSRKDKREIGLIAQEVEEVIPEIVHENTLPIFSGLDDSATSYKTVDYEKLIALLIESNKEQQEIIAQLEERVIDLENRL